MSWRTVLGITNVEQHSFTHNARNTHNLPVQLNSAKFADSAFNDSKLLEDLAVACRGLSITPIEVKKALTQEDINNWRNQEISTEALTAFAHALQTRREIDKGLVPAHYTEKACCERCGPIWLWISTEVLGCPWCWNRVAHRPIPRPQSVHCGDCIHFKRVDHPNLGHCLKDQPESIAGLWDTDPRDCSWYLPTLNQVSAPDRK